MYIAVSCYTPNSYSNALLLMDFQIKKDGNTNVVWLSQPLTANTLRRNTFKITKMTSIRNSNLIVAVLEDIGALVLNLTTLVVASETYEFIQEVPIHELVLAEIKLP